MATERSPTGKPFRDNRGGRRPGAGRKPNGEFAGVSHLARAKFAAKFPLLITIKLLPALPKLRRNREHAVVQSACARGCERLGFRVVHYGLRDDRVILIVEARGRDSLSRGLQGLLIRFAKQLNRAWQRHGKVFADRYDQRPLETPSEVRSALLTTLGNRDAFSSSAWFAGWKEDGSVKDLTSEDRPVCAARTELLASGWRKLGLLSAHEAPANAMPLRP